MDTGLLKMKTIPAAIALFSIFTFPVQTFSAASPAVTIPPAVPLIGQFDSTTQTVMPCAPLKIQYNVKNTGNTPVSSGTLKIEIKAAGTGEAVFVRHLPLTMDADSFTIENVTFPPGAYTILLKTLVMSREHGIPGEFTLAEQPLTISAPIMVKKSSIAIPRALLWLNRNNTAVQQAFAEMIVKQAFEEEGTYYTTVDTQEDFTEQAMSGEFNTLVLFETDELLERPDWLMDRLARGQGLVIIGSEDRTRMLAETFGFKFREAPPAAGTMLLLTGESGLGLAGTIPISGRILQPQKKDAKTAAVFAGDKKPAILISKAGKGKVIVAPFSFIRSALDTGATSLYSLVLRAAVHIATPEHDEQTGESSIELLVSAPSGPIKTRIVEALPPGSKVIWMNGYDTVMNDAIIYDLTVDKEPQKLLYVYRVPAGSKTAAFTEVYYECKEKIVSQGRVE
jgi:hypothetical protein